ncbi:hypothetical protein Syun_008589 [Stephania yunnanensis]|uniref:O-methyltransferase C-terminal domain-containing protein n=1 Tax=Stephania yunnanensis TaxID=152371 RepID=A0AAP0PQ56_9MAGN
MANIIAGSASGEEVITPEELVQAQSQIYKHTMIYIHSLSLKSAVDEWIKGSDGHTPFEIAHGKRPMDYLVENNEIGNVFNEAMAADSKVTASVFVTKCKAMFEGVTSLVDVGGGIGLMGRAIAEAFPHIKCSVLDLPSVVASCKGTENLEFVGGDMFQAIPSADALLLKGILNQWSDEDCIKILKRCREARLIPQKREER